MSIGGWEGRIQRRPRRASDCQERIRSISHRMVKPMGKQMRRSQGQNRITGICASFSGFGCRERRRERITMNQSLAKDSGCKPLPDAFLTYRPYIVNM